MHWAGWEVRCWQALGAGSVLGQRWAQACTAARQGCAQLLWLRLLFPLCVSDTALLPSLPCCNPCPNTQGHYRTGL